MESFSAVRAFDFPLQVNQAEIEYLEEQAQILTTQNLASLFVALDFRNGFSRRMPELSQQCFEWICRRQRSGLEWTADERTFDRHGITGIAGEGHVAWAEH